MYVVPELMGAVVAVEDGTGAAARVEDGSTDD